ncbi:piggyBac transposable element-derived protein 4-like [Gastrophryne carolinensis]
MASKHHFSISKAVLDQISDSGSDTEPLAEMSDSDSWQDSSSDSDTDQRSGDSDDSAPELSDVRTWCPIDCGMDEMTSLKRLSRRQIGLILLTGVVGKPLQKWYWTTNKLLATPFFGTIMSECRFSLIMKNLHFTNNEEFDEATHPAPKLKKIWEVYQMILKKFQQSYVPDRDISIDESLMAYKGRLSWIQYINTESTYFSWPICAGDSPPPQFGLQQP